MPESPPSPPGWGDDARRLAADAVAMLEARRDLAELELRADAAALRRLAICSGLAVVAAASGLPLLAFWAVQLLDRFLPIGDAGGVSWWLPIVAAALLAAGAAVGWSAWRRFRREWVGLRRSLGELEEDLAWLQEWIGPLDRASADVKPTETPAP